MKKTYLFLCIILIAVMTSCSGQTSGENDVVKIWWYKYDEDNLHNYVIEAALDKIKYQANLDDIEIDIKQFLESDLSYNDYILKRNLAIEHNELDMVFDTGESLYMLKDKAGSYDRMKNYENVFDNFKNLHCVPLCTDLRVSFVNNDVLLKYGIEPQNVITLDEYYDIKQRMKEAGAEFKMNEGEFKELIDYYYRKNGLKILKDEKGVYVDNGVLLKTLNELTEDIKSNYDYDYLINNENNFEYKIIEEKSGYEFSGLDYSYLAVNYEDFSRSRPDIENSTIAVWDSNCIDFYDYSNYVMPCLFIPENSKSNNVYTLADVLFSDGFQISLYDMNVGGVITNLDSHRDLIGFDEDWRYMGVKNLTDENGNSVSLKAYPAKEEEKLYEVLTKGYEVVRSMDMEYFYFSVKHYWSLKKFMVNTTIAVLKDESVLDNFDKMADDFIVNLNIKGN